MMDYGLWISQNGVSLKEFRICIKLIFIVPYCLPNSGHWRSAENDPNAQLKIPEAAI
jgi:hypothetical protein